LTISQAAKRFGWRTSALRYYEQIGVLPPPYRRGGQRRYDESAMRRLAIVRRAQQLGFSLKEVQILFSDFSNGPPISDRWNSLAKAKLGELDERIKLIREMERMLRKMMQCKCTAFDQCGEGILKSSCGTMGSP
jgi:MerR family redox-sensitive transcriptional activator SoxR